MFNYRLNPNHGVLPEMSAQDWAELDEIEDLWDQFEHELYSLDACIEMVAGLMPARVARLEGYA